MIVVIEGFSCTGKTHLSGILSAELGINVKHFGPPPKDRPFAWFMDGLNEALVECPNVILDRYHLSNFAYQDRYGGGVMDFGQWLQLDEMLAKMGAWLFLMVDDPFVIEKRIKERGRAGDKALLRWEIAEIQNRFYEALGMTRIETKGSFQFTQFVEQTGEFTPQLWQIIDQLKTQKGN